MERRRHLLDTIAWGCHTCRRFGTCAEMPVDDRPAVWCAERPFRVKGGRKKSDGGDDPKGQNPRIRRKADDRSS